jgi:hypothetical protein
MRTVSIGGYEPTWRNKIAEKISTFALRHIATPRYRDVIDSSIRLGLRAATWGDPEYVEKVVKRDKALKLSDVDALGPPHLTVPVFNNHDWSEPIGRLKIRADLAPDLCREGVGLFAGFRETDSGLELEEMSVGAVPTMPKKAK